MKLKESYAIQEVGGKVIMIGTEPNDFQGMIKLNSSAGTVVKLLREETDVNQIVSKMAEIFDADCDTLRADVEKIINKLRSINALEE